jgi:hypothetical protein
MHYCEFNVHVSMQIEYSSIQRIDTPNLRNNIPNEAGVHQDNHENHSMLDIKIIQEIQVHCQNSFSFIVTCHKMQRFRLDKNMRETLMPLFLLGN